MVELGEAPAPARTLLSDPGLPATRVGDNTTSGGSLGSVVSVVQLGSLRLFGAGGSEPGWHALADVELPLEGSSRGNRIEVRSAVPSFVGRRADGTLSFATRPMARIGRRLQVQLIDVDLVGDASVTDCWVALPEAEDLLESFFLLIDDRPALLVTTKPAGKLGLFGEKRLRLYHLERDRSRLGLAPLLATQSRMNLWQNSVPRLHDVNGDEQLDLVLGYWKGLRDDKVVLDVYLREADGSFQTEPRTTAFNVEDGDRGFLRYGTDLDGDGLADLLLRDAENRLLLYAGLSSSNGRRLVDREARRISLGEIQGWQDSLVISIGGPGADWRFDLWKTGLPRLVDVDGDGGDEIVVMLRGNGDRPGVLRVVRP